MNDLRNAAQNVVNAWNNLDITIGEVKVLVDQLQVALSAQQATQSVAWAESIEAAFRCGFSSPATYNDTLLNTADEEWEKEKADLIPQDALFVCPQMGNSVTRVTQL